MANPPVLGLRGPMGPPGKGGGSGTPANTSDIQTLGTANSAGSELTRFATSQHVHAHGTQADPTMHAVATQSAHGFLHSDDKKHLDLNWSTTLWNVKFFGAVGTVTSTTGSITSGTPTLTVASGQGVNFPVGSYLTVKGAGTDTGLLSNMLSAQVTAVVGDVLTLSKNASSTVSGAAVQTDDLPAFNAAIAAMGPMPPSTPLSAAWVGGTIYVPAGQYRWSQTFKLYRSVHLKGSHGWQFAPATKIFVDQGCGGIICLDNTTSSNNSYAGESLISDIYLWGQMNFGLNVFLSQTVWQPNTAYTVGTVIVATYLLDWGWAWMCTGAGTSGSTQPNWSAADPQMTNGPNVPLGPSGVTVSDGGVTWTAVQAHGIQYTTQVRVEDCWVAGFPGHGHACMAFSNSLSDAWRITRGRVSNCGGSGIFTRGGDSNIGIATGITCDANWGFGFYDFSFLGNSWYGMHTAENCHGACNMYVGNADGTYTESDQPPAVIQQAAMYRSSIAQGAGFTDFYVKSWSSGMSANSGDWVKPSVDNGYWFKCITGGTTGGTEPSWPKTIAVPLNTGGWSTTVNDGTAVWIPYAVSTQSTGIIDAGQPVHGRSFASWAGTDIVQFDAAINGLDGQAWGWQAPNTPAALYAMHFDKANNRWYLRNSNTGIPFMLTYTGHSLGGGQLLLNQGYYLGADQLHITEGLYTSSPGASIGTVGDIAWNSTPNSSYPDAWRCVANAPSAVWLPLKLQPNKTYSGFGGTLASPLVLDQNRDRSTWDDYNATAEVAYQLPNVASGYAYKFVFNVTTTHGLRVVAPTGQKIQLGATQSSSSGYVESTAIGSVLVVESIGPPAGSPIWVATLITGTWAAA